MANYPITKDQLINASWDAEVLEQVTNNAAFAANPSGPDGTVTSRLGTIMNSLATAIALIAASGGTIPYPTLAQLNADLAHDENTVAFVSDDNVDPTNNGFYYKVGASGTGSWVKSPYNSMTPVYNDIIDYIKRVQAQTLSKQKNTPVDAGVLFGMFVDDDNRVLAGFDKDGGLHAMFKTCDPVPYSSFDDGGFSITDEDGTVILRTNNFGELLFKSPYTFWAPLTSFDDDDVLVLIDGDNSVLASITSEGLQVGTGVKSSLSGVFDLENDTVYATATSGRNSIFTSSTQLIGLSPTNVGGGFQAAQQRPMIGGYRPIYGSADGSVIIPGSDDTLMGIPVIGQSLAIGSRGVPVIGVSENNKFPETAMMMISTHASFTDVRLGLQLYETGITPLLDSELTGFEPLIAKVAPNSTIHGQTICESMIQSIMTKCKDKVGILPKVNPFVSGIGGAAYSVLKKGTVPYQNTLTAVAGAKRLAAEKGWKYWVPGICVHHGEQDAPNANYYNNLLQWQSDYDADIRAITGQQATVKFYLTQPSSFVEGYENTVQAMYQAAMDYPDRFCLSHANYFNEYSDDLVHLTAHGYFYSGEYFARAFMTEQFGDSQWMGVRPLSYTRNNNVIDILHNVPVAPLVFDTTNVTNPGNYGFAFKDASNSAAISAVTLVGGNTVRITLNAIPTGANMQVEYAREGYPAGRPEGQGPRGNLRDSCPDRSLYDQKVLYNWAPHYILPIV